MYSWDNVQRTYACCGVLGKDAGYIGWKAPRPAQNSANVDYAFNVENVNENGLRVLDDDAGSLGATFLVVPTTKSTPPPSHSNRPLEKGSIGTKHNISGKLTLRLFFDPLEGS